MRYHISKETGRPSICRAKSPDACRAVPMFNESVVPHFENKLDAQKYIEEQLSKDDVLKSLRSETAAQKKADEKRKEAIEGSLKLFAQLKEEYGYSYSMDPFSYETEEEKKKIVDISAFIHEELPGYSEVQTNELTNYRVETIVQKDDLFYVISFYGGGYEHESFSFLNAVPAEKVFRKQIGTETALAEEISDEISMSMVEEFTNTFDQIRLFELRDDDDNAYKLLIPTSPDAWGVVLERDDGSKIHGFNLSSQRSDSALDLPYPVQFDEEMHDQPETSETDEMMDKGYALFDTRSGIGFALIYRDASENGGDPYFEWHKNKITQARENSHFQRIYTLKATGEEIQKEYYKIVE